MMGSECVDWLMLSGYASDGSCSIWNRRGPFWYLTTGQPAGAAGSTLHPPRPGPVAQCALYGP
eukprot:scaffold13084_cov112-Isochrysis_galbana.AAC.5